MKTCVIWSNSYFGQKSKFWSKHLRLTLSMIPTVWIKKYDHTKNCSYKKFFKDKIFWKSIKFRPRFLNGELHIILRHFDGQILFKIHIGPKNDVLEENLRRCKDPNDLLQNKLAHIGHPIILKYAKRKLNIFNFFKFIDMLYLYSRYL